MSPRPNRKSQLIEMATSLFQEKGYTASSMRDLAQKMGIEAASLYSHIKSKQEILNEICFSMANLFFEALDNIDRKPYPDAAIKLEKYILAHVAIITKHRDAAQVFFNEWKHLTEPDISDFIKKRDAYEFRFRQVIQDGIEQGQFAHTDAKIAVLTLLSSLNWIPNGYDPKGKLKPENIGKMISELLINGLKDN